MALEEEAQLLAQIPLFAKLEPHRLKLLAFTSEEAHFEPGQTLCYRNDPPDGVYVIINGEVEVLDSQEANTLNIVRGANALIGEMSVLTNAPRNATVRATSDVLALKISADIFLKLITDSPAAALDVMRQLSQKLAEAQNKLESLQQQ